SDPQAGFRQGRSIGSRHNKKEGPSGRIGLFIRLLGRRQRFLDRGRGERLERLRHLARAIGGFTMGGRAIGNTADIFFLGGRGLPLDARSVGGRTPRDGRLHRLDGGRRPRRLVDRLGGRLPPWIRR